MSEYQFIPFGEPASTTDEGKAILAMIRADEREAVMDALTEAWPGVIAGPLLSPKGVTTMSLTKRWLDELEEQHAMPVIYAYTDEMAIDDGALVNIESMGLTFEQKPINRITA